MNTIRLLLLEVPLVLRKNLEQIISMEPDLEIVGELESMGHDMSLAISMRPHVVVVGLDAHSSASESHVPEVAREVLANLPRTKVLGLSLEDRLYCLYELRPQKTPIGELSPAMLTAVIRKTD